MAIAARRTRRNPGEIRGHFDLAGQRLRLDRGFLLSLIGAHPLAEAVLADGPECYWFAAWEPRVWDRRGFRLDSLIRLRDCYLTVFPLDQVHPGEGPKIVRLAN